MPKEIVWGPTPDDEHVDQELFVPQVTWIKDGYVTLGLVRIQDPSDQSLGAFADMMPRKQINDLIRVLRRARDQAYGKDE